MHVVVIAPPMHGHVVPLLGVAHALVARGHRATAVVAGEFVPAARAAGVRPVLFTPTSVSAPAAEPGPVDVRFLETSRAPAAAALAALDGDRPDVVLYDFALRFAAHALSRRWKVPAVQVFPTFVTSPQLGWPDLAARMGLPAPVVDALRVAPDDEAAFVEDSGRFFASFGVERTHGRDVLAHDEDLSLVLVPRSLQLEPGTLGPRHRVVGPVLAGRACHEPWTPPGDGRDVVYVSLGTLRITSPDFFRTAAEALADDDVHVVMSVSRSVDPADLGPLTGHCEAHTHLPQLDVLRAASVFVSHGGSNSVLESLALGVPLVVAPVTPEQAVYGRVVARRGAGVLLGPAAVPDAHELRAAVDRVRADASFRAAARTLGDEALAGGGAGRAADLVEQLVRGEDLEPDPAS